MVARTKKSSKPARKPGRKPFEPTEEQRKMVGAMSGYGIPHEDIAKVIGDKGIDPKTMRKHFPVELATGHIRANAKVAENLYKQATGEGSKAVTAAIFWLKVQAGWREAPQAHEHSGAGGAAIMIRDITRTIVEPKRKTNGDARHSNGEGFPATS